MYKNKKNQYIYINFELVVSKLLKNLFVNKRIIENTGESIQSLSLDFVFDGQTLQASRPDLPKLIFYTS